MTIIGSAEARTSNRTGTEAKPHAARVKISQAMRGRGRDPLTHAHPVTPITVGQ